MDEFESEETEQEQVTRFAALPAKTQAELKKLRAAERNLRKRNEALAHDALVARFGEKIVAMVPSEVTTYERRVELAETFAEQLIPPEPEPAPEPQEVTSPGLVAIARGLAGGSLPTRARWTVKDVKALIKTDPQAAEEIIRSGRYEQQSEW